MINWELCSLEGLHLLWNTVEKTVNTENVAWACLLSMHNIVHYQKAKSRGESIFPLLHYFAHHIELKLIIILSDDLRFERNSHCWRVSSSWLFPVYRVTCAEIAEDSSVLAVGFSDSVIKVWSLVSQKLRTMKSAEILQEIDIEASQSNCSSIVYQKPNFVSKSFPQKLYNY